MTEKDGWPGDLYRSFEHSARTSPDATALTFRKQCWSYRELERAATACGSNLASVLPANSPVLVSVDTPAEAIETLLGTWYAGCIAVPVDPRWPEATLRGMAQLIEPAAAVLTDPTNRTGELYRLEGVRCWALGELRTTSGCIERRLIDPDAIGYVGTTSGSTGQPKAVFQTHRQRHAFNLGLKRLVGVLPCDRVSMLHGYGFQVGITDFMGGLLAGATVCAYDIQADGYEGLADWVHRERLTVFHWIPSPWRRFLSTLPQDCKFHGVRWFVLGSEPFPARDVAGIRRHFGDDVRIANRLGIGECGTVACHEVSGTESSEATLPAGKIQPGFEVVITDETGAQCPPGVTGEIRV